MTMTTHERPGVYSAYDASAVVSGSGGGKVVGLAALCTGAAAGEAVRITRYEDAVSAFGSGEEICELIRLLLLNGAAAVDAVPAADESGYAAAFAALEAVEDVAVVVCDSTTLAVQQALRDSVKAASAARRERIGVAAGGETETVSQLVTRAEGLNAERMVLVAPADPSGKGRAAAAVAGAIAGENDPAVPLGGAVLRGLSGLKVQYSDNEIDLLVRGGVTPLESTAGTVSPVRGITTRTTTGGAADTTWRELTTILIVDDVIPAVRQALRSKFARAKNTAQSRSAIRSQVIVELEKKVAEEIIDSYGEVTVTASEDDPTVCLVEFSFAVAHGLNQIYLTVHITV